MMIRSMREIVVDNFAGGGGASTGIEMAMGRSVDIAINHDPEAIAMHKANHPTTKHYIEDVWKVDPVEACAGRPVALAWFSPDCKHHSKAKGGKPVDKHIRGLAWVAVKWAKAVHPRVIMLENVEEFEDWGRIDPETGLPDKRFIGETFRRFVRDLEKQGYRVEYRLLRASDFGTPTSRKRFFLIARNDGRPIRWPNPKYGDPNSLEVAAGLLKPWNSAASIIDFSLPCPSIFESSDEIFEKYGIRAIRPLAEKTLRRIAHGLMKFVIENPNPFIVQVNHGGAGFRGQSIEEPLGTITSKHGTGLATPTLIQMGYGEAHGQKPRVLDINRPLGTVVAQGNKFGLVSTFIHKYYDGGYTGAGSAIDRPVGTITTVDHNSLCKATLSPTKLSRQSRDGSGRIEDSDFATCAYITQFNNHCVGQSPSAPLNTITAGMGHFGEVRAFLMKYYGSGQNCSPMDRPLPTITAKDRIGLVTIQGQDYQIADIGLRMLTPRELFDAQGFPADYIIDVDADGNPYPKSEQVARCGNAVCPQIPMELVRANLPELCPDRTEVAV